MRKILVGMVLCFLAMPLLAAIPPYSASPGIQCNALNVLCPQTAHDDVTGTDAVMTAGSPILTSAAAKFLPSMVGKVAIANGAGALGADLVTTVLSYQSATQVTLAASADATYGKTPWSTVGRAVVATRQSGAGSYAVGDTLTVTGGTGVITTGVFTIISTGVSSATVNAGGSGGTNGACVVTGTTGVTRQGSTSLTSYNTNRATAAATSYFTANVTIAGGAITAVNSIVFSGDYSTAPTSLAAEPVVNSSGGTCGAIVGATLALKMGPYFVQQTTAGQYSALPSNPVATTTNGSGAGATLTLTADQVGGIWAIGTDDSAAINGAITQVMAAGGGTVVLPRGRSLMLAAIAPTFTGTTQPTQNPLRITGAGMIANGYWAGIGPSGAAGTILDMRYTGADTLHPAKIDTRGSGGKLQIDHLTISDGGTDNFLFLQTTNTTLDIEQTTWSGNPSCYQMTCQQNVLSLGGLTSASSTLGTSASTAGFQGYLSQFIGNYFEHIQEAFELGGSANSITTIANMASLTDGSYSATKGFIHMYGVALGTTGNQFNGDGVEVGGYLYGVVGTSSGGGNNEANYFNNTQIADPTVGNPTLGGFNFDVNTVLNEVNTPDVPFQLGTSTPFLAEASNDNIWIRGDQHPSEYPFGVNSVRTIQALNLQSTGSSTFGTSSLCQLVAAGGSTPTLSAACPVGSNGEIDVKPFANGAFGVFIQNGYQFVVLPTTNSTHFVEVTGSNGGDAKITTNAGNITVGSTGGTTTLRDAATVISGTVTANALGTVTPGTNGAVCASSSGQLGANTANCIVSLAALKNIHRTIGGFEGLRITFGLTGIWYDYKTDPLHVEQPGYTAEQVETVCQACVIRTADGKLSGVRYEQIVAVVTKAVAFACELIGGALVILFGAVTYLLFRPKFRSFPLLGFW